MEPNNSTDITLDIAGAAEEQGLQGSEYLGQEDAGFAQIIGTLMQAVLLIGVLACFVFIVLGGIEWITSGGDKGKLESARNKITNAVVGLIVLAASTAAILVIQTFLGIEFLSFSFTN